MFPSSPHARPFAALLVVVVLASACSSSASPAADGAAASASPATTLVVDDCGREVEFVDAPQRVLTIGTSAAVLLDAAGAADRVVARAGEFGSGLPDAIAEHFADVPIIDPADPSLEVIVDVEPDLVFGYGLFGADPVDLEAAGITTLTVAGECGHDGNAEDGDVRDGFEILVDEVRTLGRLFGTSTVADPAADALADRVAAVREAREDAEPLTAAGVYFFGGHMSVTGGRGVAHDQIEALGLVDVHEDLDAAFAEVQVEALLDADPAIILLTYGFEGDDFDTALQMLLAQPGAEDLQAVREDRVIGLPATLRHADPGAVEGLEYLAAELAERRDAGS